MIRSNLISGKSKLTFGSDDPATRDRLRELILYIAERSQDDPKFGATKLNKILYYSDFVSFREYGEPITGAQYMKLDKGPAPTHLVPVRKEMLASGEIALESRQYYTYQQTVLKPLRKPNLQVFKARDIALVDAIIRELRQLDASELSDLSHNRAWQIANEREAIPYEAIFLSDASLTEDDIAWAQELAGKCGLDET